MLCLQQDGSGGEGGIRTLDTGFSPYNGLANGPFSPPSLVFKHLHSCSQPSSRAQCPSFGSYCAPLCAPPSGCNLILTTTVIRCSAAGNTTTAKFPPNGVWQSV